MLKKSLYFLSFLVLILFVYAHWVEPVWIEVTRHFIQANVRDPLRIAHVTDLHIRSMGAREEKILSLLEQEKPDVIMVAGDSIAESGNYLALGNFIKQMRAPLGIWVVNGNWEHWRPSDVSAKIYQAAGVKFLNNTAEKLVDGVWVIGIDDEYAGSPDLGKALRGVPKDALKIGLFHSPAFF